MQWDYNFDEWTCEELLKIPLTSTELTNSASAVTNLLLYISTMETSFVYPLINKANISRDPTNAKTLGPFAFALFTILQYVSESRITAYPDYEHYYGDLKLFRAGFLTFDQIEEFISKEG